MSAIARKTARPMRRRRRAACALAAAAAAAAAQGAQADVTVKPRLQVEQAYTDNVRGAPKGQEEGDFYTTVTPGVSVVSRGGRFEGALDYSLIYEEYFDTKKLGGFSNSLLTTNRAELWDDRLFFDAAASLQRAAANRRGAISATGRDVGQNQTEVLNVSAGPTLRLDFAGFAQSETTLEISRTMFDPLQGTASADSDNFGTRPLNISDSTTYSFQQRFDSGRDFAIFGWSLLGTYEVTEQDDEDTVTTTGEGGQAYEQSSLIASGQYRVNRHLSLLGSAGYESIEGETITNEDVSGAVFSAGFRVTGARSTLRFEAGRRYGGETYSYDSSYRFSPFLTFNSFYSEAVTTQSRTGQTALDSLIVDAEGNFIDPRTGLPFQPNDPAFDLTNEDTAFRTRTFGNGLVGTRGRNSYAISAFRTTRESLGVDREEIITGGTARIGRKLWPKLSGDLSASYTDTQDDASGDQTLLRVGASLQYALGEDLTTTLTYSHLSRSGDGAGGGLGGGLGLDLEENVVALRVLKVF